MLTWLAKRRLQHTPAVATVRCWPGGGHLNEVWNWGDAISPTIYKMITGSDPNVIDYRNYTREPHLIICGSTLRWVSRTSIVWGAGAIAEDGLFMHRGEKPLQIAAVRGPLTQKRFIDAGVACPNVFGDPALLFPEYYQPAVEPEFELGIIPHYIDQDLAAVKHLADDPQVRILDITQKDAEEKVYSFIDEVARCKRIASSSLHGLILADSYNIPSLWLEFSKNVVGKGFKFHDYFQSVGRTETMPIQIMDNRPEVAEIIKFIDKNRYNIRFKAHRLLNSFPA